MATDLADRLRGVIPPVVTPLTRERTFDSSSAENLYRFMLETGVHGIFLFGTSGEGPLLGLSEQSKVLETAIRVIDKQVPVLVGILEPGTDRAIAVGRMAQDLGADAIVVCPPFYFPADQNEVLQHFRAIRQAIDLPIVAYDIPSTTKVKIDSSTMLELAAEGTIVAVKDSSGDAVGFRKLIAQRPANFRLLTGAELLADTVLLQGAHGIVPGLSNVAPEFFVRLIDHWQAGRPSEMADVQNAIIRLFEVFLREDGTLHPGYAIGAMKTALMQRGIIETNQTCRPFLPLTHKQEQRVRTILSEVGIL